MGPGSFLALGRALAMAAAHAALDPRQGGGRALIAQVQKAVHSQNEALARQMLEHLKRQDKALFDELIRQMEDDAAAWTER